MKPFEVLGADGRIYLHHDNWDRWRDERLSVHPGEGKWRFDLDLRNPRDTLEEVPVANEHVHSHGDFTPRTCFYECSDWSTIYDFYCCSDEPMYRMIVESQNPEPIWGEQITLLSTSSYFKSEPWGRNTPNQFAYFRGQYWQVSWSELLYHEFPAGVGYPLRDGRIANFNGHLRWDMNTPRRGGPTFRRADGRPWPNTIVLDPEAFRRPRGILTRYGLHLLEEGRQFYGTVRIGANWNYPQPEFKLDWRKYGF